MSVRHNRNHHCSPVSLNKMLVLPNIGEKRAGRVKMGVLLQFYHAVIILRKCELFFVCMAQTGREFNIYLMV